jgi:hypothetical protein
MRQEWGGTGKFSVSTTTGNSVADRGQLQHLCISTDCWYQQVPTYMDLNSPLKNTYSDLKLSRHVRTFLLLHAAHLDMSLPILCNVQWWENGGGGSVLCSLFGGSWWCRWREVAWYFWTPFCLSLLSLDIIYGPKKVRCKSTWWVKSDLRDYAWQRWCLCMVEYYASIQTKLSLLISFLPNFKAW